MRKISFTLVLVAFLFGVGLFTVTERSLVDWRQVHAVALESDDWGLPGFVPQADSWLGLDRDALGPGNFPPVYWQSTLEDSVVITRLAEMMATHLGRDGVAAVFQPNYVMGSLSWGESSGGWVRFDLPHWPAQYQRPGLWSAVETAQSLGVWYPELHAALHYDPAVRQVRGLESDLAREVTRRGIMLFPGSEHAWELAPGRPVAVLADELDHSLAVFQRVFGRPVGSVIAPDYTWSADLEDLWQSRGLRVIQAKREQRSHGRLAGPRGRGQKYLDRQWAKLWRPGRVYLERNCRLEPVQSADPSVVVAQCLADTRLAWQKGEPAIVETHRVNFAHTDSLVVETGLAALADFLSGICTPEDGPTFLCDREIGQMMRQGVSWRRVGDHWILRNLSHTARVVVLSGPDLVRLGSDPCRTLFISLAADDVALVSRNDSGAVTRLPLSVR